MNGSRPHNYDERDAVELIHEYTKASMRKNQLHFTKKLEDWDHHKSMTVSESGDPWNVLIFSH